MNGSFTLCMPKNASAHGVVAYRVELQSEGSVNHHGSDKKWASTLHIAAVAIEYFQNGSILYIKG